MRARLSAALAVFAIMTAPAMAEETVLLHAAGSLRAVLAVGADYGLTVMNGASVPAHRFALFILSAEGYRTLAKHGFAARALPQWGIPMFRSGLVAVTLLALLGPARAADDGCEKFAWSLARERAAVAAADKTTVAAGEALAALPAGALVIRLQTAAQASFEMPPERKPRTEQWHGGMVRLPVLAKPGIYQITLSDDAWIDVIQNGRYARSVGSTGRSDCPGVRKSVRLDLDASPVVLQLSGVSPDTIAITIGAVE